MRKDGVDRAGRNAYVAKSEKQIEIKKIMLELGIAEMVTLGDWSVNREEAIPSDMGVVSFEEIETMLLEFYQKNGVIDGPAPLGQNKLIHLDLGCGNGIVGERLRHTEVSPFGEEGGELTDYWSEVGFADRMYFTLNDMLCSCLRDEYRKNEDVLEFINIVARLITRKIYFGRERGKPKSASKARIVDELSELPHDPNLIKDILPKLRRYISSLTPRLEKINADVEFPVDQDHFLSEGCKAIIREYVEGNESEGPWGVVTNMNEAAWVSDESGRTDYTSPVFYELTGYSPYEASRLRLEDFWRYEGGMDEVVAAKSLGIRTRKGYLRRKDGTEIEAYVSEPDSVQKRIALVITDRSEREDRKAFRKDRMAAKRIADAFSREGWEQHTGSGTKGFLEKYFRTELVGERSEVDLAGLIAFYTHNVVIGDFDEFGEILPKKPMFNLAHAFRSSSHAEDGNYREITAEVAKRLRPGGIIVEEGFSESYTRYDRIKELLAIQESLGPEYRMRFIANNEGPRSVLIERAITKEGGERVFFADCCGERLKLEGHRYVPLEEYSSEWPERAFKNGIVRMLRKKLIERTVIDGTIGEAERWRRVFRGRLRFQGLHDAISEFLEEKVFKDNAWKDEVRELDTDSSRYHDLAYQSLREITEEIEDIKLRLEAVDAIPLKRDAHVRVFPRRSLMSTNINKHRSIRATNLPRNHRHNYHECDDSDESHEDRFDEGSLDRLQEDFPFIDWTLVLGLNLGLPDPEALYELRSREERFREEYEARPSRDTEVYPFRSGDYQEVPGLDDSILGMEREAMVTNLANLRKMTGKPPIVVVEFDDCFTNTMMTDTLRMLIGEDLFSELVEVQNVKLGSREYPEQREGAIYILGGSLNSVADEGGKAFTEGFSQQLLQDIKGIKAMRAIGVCFGSQSILQALGGVQGRDDFRIEQGALQFGAFPVLFGDADHPALKYIYRRSCSAVMTRGDYSIVPTDAEDIEPLVTEMLTPTSGGYLPPVGYSLLNGKVTTFQFHPEMMLTDDTHLRIAQRYLQRHADELHQEFGRGIRPTRFIESEDHPRRVVSEPVPSPMSFVTRIFEQHFRIDAEDVATGDRVGWIENDIGPALLVPTLYQYSKDLIYMCRGIKLQQ